MGCLVGVEVGGAIIHHLWSGSISQGENVSGEGGSCEPSATNIHSSCSGARDASLIKGWESSWNICHTRVPQNLGVPEEIPLQGDSLGSAGLKCASAFSIFPVIF